MKKGLLLALLAFAATPLAWAQPLSLSGGIGMWRQDFSGDIAYDKIAANRDRVDVSRDLDIEDEQKLMFYIALEHPVPILPNLRILHSQVESSGDAIINRNIDFGGTTYPVNRQVLTDLNFNHTDLTLYYNLLDTGVKLDGGLTVRLLDGKVGLISPESAPGFGDQISEKRDFSIPIPMIYGSVNFDILGSGFFVGSEINAIAYDGSKFIDFKVGGGYLTSFNVGIEAGYRRMDIVIDDIDDVDADVTVKGIYAGLNFRF